MLPTAGLDYLLLPALFALTGVTTVRGMLGDPRHLAYQARAARTEILSPTIYTSGGPSFTGATAPTAAARVSPVRWSRTTARQPHPLR